MIRLHARDHCRYKNGTSTSTLHVLIGPLHVGCDIHKLTHININHFDRGALGHTRLSQELFTWSGFTVLSGTYSVKPGVYSYLLHVCGIPHAHTVILLVSAFGWASYSYLESMCTDKCKNSQPYSNTQLNSGCGCTIVRCSCTKSQKPKVQK